MNHEEVTVLRFLVRKGLREVIGKVLDYEDMHLWGCATTNEIPLVCDCSKWDNLETLVGAIEKALAPIGDPTSTTNAASFTTFLEANVDK